MIGLFLPLLLVPPPCMSKSHVPRMVNQCMPSFHGEFTEFQYTIWFLSPSSNQLIFTCMQHGIGISVKRPFRTLPLVALVTQNIYEKYEFISNSQKLYSADEYTHTTTISSD